MKHGFLKGDYRSLILQPSPSFFVANSLVHIGEQATYRFDGYKQSIIEFLVKPENIDRVLRFEKNTSVDEYGTSFSDSNLFIIVSELSSGPTTPGGAVIESVRQAAGGLALGAITGTVAALGAVGHAVVAVYEIISGVDSVVSNHVDLRAKAADLASKKMYKNPVTRQLHHKMSSRIGVGLRGRVNASVERAYKVIDTGSTSITCGALAVLINERV